MGRYVPKLAPLDPCPVEHVVALVGGKWKARILHRLTLSDCSIVDLRRHLPRVRQQVLAAQLSSMEEHGLVRRLAPRSGELWGRFEITTQGRSLHEALAPIAQWGSLAIGGWTPPTLAAQVTDQSFA